MAKAKKSRSAKTKTTRGPGEKKPAASAKTKRKKSVEVPRLTKEERQKLAKAPDGFEAVVERLVEAWRRRTDVVRVAGATPARLKGALRKAIRAAERERALRAAFEAKLAPLVDARMRTESEAWRVALDVWAAVKAQTRVLPQIGEEFAFMGEVFARSRKHEESPPAKPTATNVPG